MANITRLNIIKFLELVSIKVYAIIDGQIKKGLCQCVDEQNYNYAEAIALTFEYYSRKLQRHKKKNSPKLKHTETGQSKNNNNNNKKSKWKKGLVSIAASKSYRQSSSLFCNYTGSESIFFNES